MASPDPDPLPEQQAQRQTQDVGSNQLVFFAQAALAIDPSGYLDSLKSAVPNYDGADEQNCEVEGDDIEIDAETEVADDIKYEDNDMDIAADNGFVDKRGHGHRSTDAGNDAAADDTIANDKLQDMASDSDSELESIDSDWEPAGFPSDFAFDYPDLDTVGENNKEDEDMDGVEEAEWNSVSSKGKGVSPATIRRRSKTTTKGKSASQETVKYRSYAKLKDRRRDRAARGRRVRARVQRRTGRRQEEPIYKNFENDEDNERDLHPVKAMGIKPTMEDLFTSLDGVNLNREFADSLGDGMNMRRQNLMRLQNNDTPLNVRRNRDFFGGLSQYPELVLEICKHLRCKDFISLYAISKDFHETINGHMTHLMKTCASYHAPESAKIFVFTFYEQLCMIDPVGRPHPFIPNRVRKVPSLKWLQMVMHRERVVRDILACMARQGHRMPKSMSLTLKKMWLTMDISTCAGRVKLMHNQQFWTDFDLYNVMMFVVKLDMRCNDPLIGPGDDGLRKLFLGQRGLTPLRNLLKRTAYKTILEVIELAVRYEYTMKTEHILRRLSIFGVPWYEVGRGHLEGWGAGRAHLYRVDELMLRESARRGLQLGTHLVEIMFWGYVDPVTKRTIKVTDEETYMSDDEDEYESRREVENRGEGRDGWEEIDAQYDDDDDDEDNDDGADNGANDGAGGDSADEWETENEDMNEGPQSEDELGD
jgi:hypothetical protein